MKTNILTIIAALLLIVFAGCGQKEPADSSPAPPAPEKADKAEPRPEKIDQTIPAKTEAAPDKTEAEAPERTEPAAAEVKPAVEPDKPEAAAGKTEPAPEVLKPVRPPGKEIAVSVKVCKTESDLERIADSKMSRITFDDIETTSDQPVAFKADRYASSRGIIIKGQGGQYADDSFGWNEKLNPVSAPAMYAPGPASDKPDTGGNTTVITFTADGRPAAAAAFGVYLIDADNPAQGPSSVTIHGRDGKILKKQSVSGRDRQQVFTGLVTVDSKGRPISAIHSVTIVNGSGWAGVRETEVVFIDDMVFSPPTAE